MVTVLNIVLFAAGEPKTSEYAFFKKLKTKAAHGSQSRPLDKEESGSKLLGSSYLSNVDCSGAIKNSFNDLRLPIEPCLNPDLLLSPVGTHKCSQPFPELC